MGGTLLQDVQGGPGGTILELATSGASVAKLRCEHLPGVLEPVPASMQLTSRQEHHTLAYEAFDHALEKWSFFEFDWRLDMRHVGQLLLAHLERIGVGDRWHIVAHSQGGLLVLWAARLAGAEKFAQLVRSVVFVGVPFFGTLAAAAALLEGDVLGVQADAFRVAARTWPAVYQLLPRWAVAGSSAYPDLLLNETWWRAGLLPEDLGQVSLQHHVDPSLLERGRQWHQAMFLGPFDALRKLAYVRMVFGANLPTRESAPNFPKLSMDGNGDSSVPYPRTVRMMPDWVQQEASIVATVAARHMLLCSDPNIYPLCDL